MRRHRSSACDEWKWDAKHLDNADQWKRGRDNTTDYDTHTHTYTHIHIHTHTLTHTHTHTHSHSLSLTHTHIHAAATVMENIFFFWGAMKLFWKAKVMIHTLIRLVFLGGGGNFRAAFFSFFFHFYLYFL